MQVFSMGQKLVLQIVEQIAYYVMFWFKAKVALRWIAPKLATPQLATTRVVRDQILLNPKPAKESVMS
jgi:hypothetical protein